VIDQTFKNWELLVVDDGSTDETALQVSLLKAADSRIVQIRRPVNSRHESPRAEPMNDGLAKARGEYIAYLDDDNQWEPEYLETLVKEFRDDPKLVLAYVDTRDHMSVEALANLRDDRERIEISETCVVFPHLQKFPGYREFPSGRGYLDYIDTNEMMQSAAALRAVGGLWPVAHRVFESINQVQGVTHRTHNDLAIAESLIDMFGLEAVSYVPRLLNNYLHRSHPQYDDGQTDFRISQTNSAREGVRRS